jgi:hypothetical protein
MEEANPVARASRFLDLLNANAAQIRKKAKLL